MTKLNNCQLPFSDIQRAIFELFNDAFGQSPFRNPLDELREGYFNIALDAGGCLTASLNSATVISGLGGLTSPDYLALVGLRDEIERYQKPAVPLQFPTSFLNYFPLGFPTGFVSDFMSGFPAGLPPYLPPKFKTDFENKYKVVPFSNMSPEYRKVLSLLQIDGDVKCSCGQASLPMSFVNSRFNFASPDEIPEPLIQDLTKWSVNTGHPNIFEPDYVAGLNLLHTLMPPTGFKAELPPGITLFPPPGFTGFDLTFIATVNSDFNKYNYVTDMMSGAILPIPGLADQPDDLAFTTLAQNSLMAMQIRETFTPSPSLEFVQQSASDLFYPILPESNHEFGQLGDTLATIASIACSNPANLVQNILNQNLAALQGVLATTMALLLSQIPNVRRLNLLNVALGQLLGQSSTFISLGSKGPGICEGMASIVDRISGDKLRETMGKFTEAMPSSPFNTSGNTQNEVKLGPNVIFTTVP